MIVLPPSAETPPAASEGCAIAASTHQKPIQSHPADGCAWAGRLSK
jgi:hypothetical protein